MRDWSSIHLEKLCRAREKIEYLYVIAGVSGVFYRERVLRYMIIASIYYRRKYRFRENGRLR